MKIDSEQLLAAVSRAKSDAVAPGESRQSGNQEIRGRQSDSVELSSHRGEVDHLKKVLNAVPDVRSDKVAQLKERIENGTYRIDGRAVAAKMLKSWGELHGK